MPVEIVQDFVDVPRDAAETAVAAAVGLHVAVEAGQLDDAHAVRRAVAAEPDREDRSLGRLVLRVDLLAHHGVNLAAPSVGRNDLQADHRAALAADEFHNVADLHVDHVGQVSLLALPHADHLVVFLQAAVLVGRPALDDLLDDRVAVVVLQRAPDALEVQSHDHVEVFFGFRRHVGGMGVERGRQRVQIEFQQLVAADLVHLPGSAAIVPLQFLLRVLRVLLLLVHLGLEDVELQLLPPPVRRLGRSPRIAEQVPVGDHLLVGGELQGPSQQLLDRFALLVDPLQNTPKTS